MSDITQLLEAAASGDRYAAAELLPLVYDELRKLAAARMANEQSGHTLQPTALVHEAYLRLVVNDSEKAPITFDNRGHFFAAAAEAMRRILVDAARRKKRDKHGGNLQRVQLNDVASEKTDRRNDLIALDEALTRLASVDEQAARMVELRHFGGMSIPDIAQLLNISPRSADRLWAFARAWLHRELVDFISDQKS